MSGEDVAWLWTWLDSRFNSEEVLYDLSNWVSGVCLQILICSKMWQCLSGRRKRWSAIPLPHSWHLLPLIANGTIKWDKVSVYLIVWNTQWFFIHKTFSIGLQGHVLLLKPEPRKQHVLLCSFIMVRILGCCSVLTFVLLFCYLTLENYLLVYYTESYSCTCVGVNI